MTLIALRDNIRTIFVGKRRELTFERVGGSVEHYNDGELGNINLDDDSLDENSY